MDQPWFIWSWALGSFDLDPMVGHGSLMEEPNDRVQPPVGRIAHEWAKKVLFLAGHGSKEDHEGFGLAWIDTGRLGFGVVLVGSVAS